MRLIGVGCSSCGAEWEELERDGIRPLCATCGSTQIEKLLFGGTKKAGDLARLARDVRIAGAARLLGAAAKVSAQESGDWESYEENGDDPNNLEAEYWLTADRRRLDAALSKEGIVLTEAEEEAAADAFRHGWDLA